MFQDNEHFFLFFFLLQGEFNQSISLNTQRTKQISFRDEPDKLLNKDSNCQPELPANVRKSSVSPNRATVSNHTPKVHVIADYIM